MAKISYKIFAMRKSFSNYLLPEQKRTEYLYRYRDLNPGLLAENQISWTGLDDNGMRAKNNLSRR